MIQKWKGKLMINTKYKIHSITRMTN